MILQDRRERTFKMRLTNCEADKIKSWAHKNELSQADYVRFMVFSRTTYAPPNGNKLQAICQKLAGIANNINQFQRSINSAYAKGALTAKQLEKMSVELDQCRRAWADPLTELRAELGKLKPKL